MHDHVIHHNAFFTFQRMATLKYSVGLTPSDPDTQPVIILGQIRHLARVSWDTIKVKLEPQVTEAVRSVRGHVDVSWVGRF